MRLIPSGTALTATPCSERPTITGTSEDVSAQIRAPTTSSARVASSTLRLPTMSPSRPAIGVATAPPSRVAVMTHEASAVVVCSSAGSWGTIGTTSVMHSEAIRPTEDSTATTRAGRAGPSRSTARVTEPPRRPFRVLDNPDVTVGRASTTGTTTSGSSQSFRAARRTRR